MTDYAAIDAVNASSLKPMMISPRHYQWHLMNDRDETEALSLGTAVHMAILEPDRFAATYQIRPEWVKGNTKEGKAWLTANAGIALLTEKQHETVCAMAQAVERHEVARSYLRRIKSVEHILTWTDDETGIACKGRLDALLDDGTILDLKSTRDADPRRFAGDVAKFGYDLSMAFYYDGAVANGITPPEMILLAVESVPPFDVVVYRLDEDVIEVGREKYRDCLVKLAKCRVSGKWPGRADAVVSLDLPTWAYPTEKLDTLEGWEGLEQEDARE